MMCSAYQYANEDDARFCEQCGHAFENPCPACGTPAKPQARFCRQCSHKLTPPDAVPTAVVSLLETRSFDDKLDRLQRYLPSHLSDKILASRGRLSGERKIVAVLFADISLKAFREVRAKVDVGRAYLAGARIALRRGDGTAQGWAETAREIFAEHGANALLKDAEELLATLD